jgi:hypothetical protein
MHLERQPHDPGGGSVESAPHKAHRPRKRRAKPGKLPDLVRILWQAVLEAEAVLHSTNGDNPELTLRAAHCLSQCAGQYAKLLEVGELEQRILALEQRGGTPR